VVDMEALRAFGFPADPAGPAVAREDARAQAAEVQKITALGGVTAPAEAPYECRRGSAGPAP
jgi:hypothetical protein